MTEEKPKGYIKGDAYADDPENFHAKKTEHQDFVEALCFNEGFSRSTVLELLYMGYIYDPETKGWEKPGPDRSRLQIQNNDMCVNCGGDIYQQLKSADSSWFHVEDNNRYCRPLTFPYRIATPRTLG